MNNPRVEVPMMIFPDLSWIPLSYNNPLIVTMIIENAKMHRMLIDMGSSSDIIFMDTHKAMGLTMNNLQPIMIPLVAFNGERTFFTIYITHLIAGEESCCITTENKFLVVDLPSANNVILGRTPLNELDAVISTMRMLMRFPAPFIVGEVHRDHKRAQECYNITMREKKKSLAAPQTSLFRQWSRQRPQNI